MPPKERAHIKLLYDISSPYSNIAFTILYRYKEAWNLEIELCPIFLGGIMVATTNQAPATNPHQFPHGAFDAHRTSARFGVDIRSPPGHPMKTTSLNMIRLLRAIRDEEGQEMLEKCTRLILHEFYAVQTPYTSLHFYDCLIPTLTLQNLQHLLRCSQSAENKQGVKDDVLQAVEKYGMFGAPYMVATRPTDGKWDVFFGADKIEDMGWFLGDEHIWKGPYSDGRNTSTIWKWQLEAKSRARL